jgi:hypothetical protein
MTKMKTYIGKDGKLKKLYNPLVCIYHSTTEDRLSDILQNGLNPSSTKRCEEVLMEVAESEGLSEEEITELKVSCESPSIRTRQELDELLGREDGVYFVKDKKDIIEREAVVEVPAERLQCRCIEDNYDLENELYDLLFQSYSVNYPMPSQEEIWDLTERIENSVRPLDDKDNEYVTEVICPCKIPPDIIRPLGSNEIGSCRIEN